MKINLGLLLKLRDTKDEIDKLTSEELDQIFSYTYKVEGGDDDSLVKQEKIDSLKSYLNSKEFDDNKKWYRKLDGELLK